MMRKPKFWPKDNEFIIKIVNDKSENNDIFMLNTRACNYNINEDVKVTIHNATTEFLIEHPMGTQDVIMNVLSRCKHLPFNEIRVLPKITTPAGWDSHTVTTHLTDIVSKTNTFFGTRKTTAYIDPAIDLAKPHVAAFIRTIKNRVIGDLAGYQDMLNGLALNFQRSSIEPLVSLIDSSKVSEALVLFFVEHKLMLILGIETATKYFVAFHEEGYFLKFLIDLYQTIWPLVFVFSNSVFIKTQELAVPLFIVSKTIAAPLFIGTFYYYYQTISANSSNSESMTINNTKYLFDGKPGEYIAQVGDFARKATYAVATVIYEAYDGFGKGLLYPRAQMFYDFIKTTVANNPELADQVTNTVTKTVKDAVKK